MPRAGLDICRNAILEKDFEALADIIELDSNMMHSVMMTSQPPLMYWSPKSLEIMLEVTQWRKKGIPAAYTLDAGPNVHVICTKEYADRVRTWLEKYPGGCLGAVFRSWFRCSDPSLNSSSF